MLTTHNEPYALKCIRHILQKHVVLYNYGQDVMAAHNALLTPYGLVQRRDGEPIRNEETQAENAGMEMM